MLNGRRVNVRHLELALNADNDETSKKLVSIVYYENHNYMLDSSYCTQMPMTTPKEIIDMALRSIMDEICDDVRIGRSIKKKCEMLSWLKPSDFRLTSKKRNA